MSMHFNNWSDTDFDSGSCIWKKTLSSDWKGVMYVCGCDDNLALFRTDYANHERCPNCHKLIQYVGLNGKVIKCLHTGKQLKQFSQNQ